MAKPVALSKGEILRLFELLNVELRLMNTQAEVCLVGGAVMCVAFDARASTRDVDAAFAPASAVREAAARVAAKTNLPDTWLNDAVKAWLGPRSEFEPFREYSHLKVLIPSPKYLLAMKCVAMRLGEEFHDLDDVGYLLRYLNITRSNEALAVVADYFDESQIPTKTRLALEEMLSDR